MTFRSRTPATIGFTAGLLATAFGGASGAAAFDQVQWNWTLDTEQRETVDIVVSGQLYPTGSVSVEKLQIYDGVPTATATATLGTFTNDKPIQNQDGTVDLPEVNVTATAAANVDSIESEVSTNVHSGQFAYAGIETGEETIELLANGVQANQGAGNSHHQILALLGLLTIEGLLGNTVIDATATAESVENASANVAATALTNAESISLLSDEPSEAILSGGDFAAGDGEGLPGLFPVRGDEKLSADITQFGYSDNAAHASLQSQSMGGYTNLRVLPAIGDPAVVAGHTSPAGSVTASAIGNVATIKVGVLP